MGLITKSELYSHFKKEARNSSHFVWLLGDYEFYECRNHWIFAYIQIGPVTLIALEPLCSDPENAEQLRDAWEEFKNHVRPKITAFVAIETSFQFLLGDLGFDSIKIGIEPWVTLENYIPRGNAGKGVRSARNQALRHGMRVEEYSASQITESPEIRKVMLRILRKWKNSRILQLNAFLNAVDPFSYPESRRYFLLKNPKNQIVGFLVATEIPGIQSYFLEDLLLQLEAPKGSAELLTLEAMRKLKESGIRAVSLGVVSGSTADASKLGATTGVPRAIRILVGTLPAAANRLYNFNGLDIYRRRFNPGVWKNIHLAVKNEPNSGYSPTTAWIFTLSALLWAFKPRIKFSLTWLERAVISPIKAHPVTFTVAIVSFTLFARLNHFGALPEPIISRFAFANDAPFSEWWVRSVVSDFLYFDLTHFIFCVIPLLAVIWWTEKSHRVRFTIPLIAFICVFDDFFNFVFVIKPFSFIRPEFYKSLVDVKDVGGSLWLATLIGLQLCQIKRNREILFSCLSLTAVFGFVYNSEHLVTLILNMNHFLFISLGYITGKLKFEYERRQSRKVAKNRPPVAACVLPPN